MTTGLRQVNGADACSFADASAKTGHKRRVLILLSGVLLIASTVGAIFGPRLHPANSFEPPRLPAVENRFNSLVRVPEAPGNDEVRQWFADNQERFRGKSTISFRHLYFSGRAEQPNAPEIAVQVLRRISQDPDSPAANLADPFMFRHYYARRTRDQVSAVFGPDFAREVFTLTPGAWRGPLASRLGWHLVWVDAIKPGALPRFDDIEETVKVQFMAAQRDAASAGLPQPFAGIPVSSR